MSDPSIPLPVAGYIEIVYDGVQSPQPHLLFFLALAAHGIKFPEPDNLELPLPRMPRLSTRILVLDTPAQGIAARLVATDRPAKP
ncbi:hypothetical protein [Streptomyces hiroshimensis]|uniref:hypothetical protein n=1 Tax=Streptomyces hiroshimensis TaxID=66424 RepID=UPI001676C0B7|nr:hypothetical protein [Streptomyces hiroshimensis]